MVDELRRRGKEDDRSLVLDELAERLERFAALRDTDSTAADSVLDELGATSDIDRDIVMRALGPGAAGVSGSVLRSPCAGHACAGGTRPQRSPAGQGAGAAGARVLRPVAEFGGAAGDPGDRPVVPGHGDRPAAGSLLPAPGLVSTERSVPQCPPAGPARQRPGHDGLQAQSQRAADLPGRRRWPPRASVPRYGARHRPPADRSWRPWSPPRSSSPSWPPPRGRSCGARPSPDAGSASPSSAPWRPSTRPSAGADDHPGTTPAPWPSTPSC